ncbi:DUF1289 domain-containing protein [Photobacterium carnosum]|uniref:DUF1289 domain-containing protein n=1 Tax=Photobacterium carnosum TaxID=2023717 RepID=UPI001E2D451A|nr:DUF1289 domain-containing protein [Photobacterium carnosum]MCD9531205.1 DUF1289 domain-containing protein [Photobacterium carnosum]MCF2153396.1 DUF1289 domain-containing protein [Photobacterium carnosum]MCF2215156.1 DUF1289 domain-containing protein [Photobacterium carnosum]
MKSPCIAKCKNNAGICSGCLRTMTEISHWIAYSEQQQLTIMAEIKAIKATHQCPQCQQPAQCDIQAGKSTCWCFDIEPRQTLTDSANTCLCRQCLSLMPTL